jgi:hypothetical protein
MSLENEHPCIVLHKGQVWKGLLFSSVYKARNAVKMANPKRKFKEVQPNVFVCTRYGTKYEVIKLINY